MDDPVNVLKHLCVKNSVSGSILGFLEAKMWTKDKLQQYTTQFISPSGFMKNKMEEAGFKKEKISHLYNFINPDQFNYHFSKEDYFIYLGRIVKEKGIETLLKAAVANTRFKLKIIGDGPLRSELQQKYHRDNIQFLGYLNREKTEFLLGRAKFMVLPAEWYENNPLSIIESLTVGTPVLGADIGGIPEQIDPQNGRLFIPGNLNDLIEKIHFMNSFDWNYELISKTAIEKYSAQKYYEELIKIYQKTRGNELHSIPH
jgi:glycosyltransferase involved in cell wall biosynthesis